MRGHGAIRETVNRLMRGGAHETAGADAGSSNAMSRSSVGTNPTRIQSLSRRALTSCAFAALGAPTCAFATITALTRSAHALVCAPPTTQQIFDTLVASEEPDGDHFGCSVGSVGDVDGDGIGDFVVGDPLDVQLAPSLGRVWVYSGRHGAVIRTIDGPQAGTWFGVTVNGAGDTNADGVPDVVVASLPARPWDHAGTRSDPGSDGQVFVYSGKDGGLLRSFRGDRLGARFGTSIASAGDWDRDGAGDIVVGAPGRSNTDTVKGYAAVMSVKDGRTIVRWDAHAARDSFGTQVTSIGDLNGDGFVDVAVATSVGWTRVNGYLDVYSGKDNSRVYSVPMKAASGAFASVLHSVFDVNADGVHDFIVSSTRLFPGRGDDWGRVHVHSGKSGELIRDLFERNAAAPFGYQAVPVGDIDEDGVPDLVVSSINAWNQRPGVLTWYSARTGTRLTSKIYDMNLGVAMCPLNDIDGDGINDFVAASGSPEPFGLARPYRGRVAVLSGRTGHTIYSRQR